MYIIYSAPVSKAWFTFWSVIAIDIPFSHTPEDRQKLCETGEDDPIDLCINAYSFYK
ncbi:MAG: hypothetical protein M3139_00150 [Bacteroidota bacterium]|nr:hypothetical protein [Bacteroidota bacterium]